MKRNTFSISFLLGRGGGFLGAAWFLACASLATAASPGHPNILLVISDDQGIGDFGFMGNKLVQTPNIDRFSTQSAVMPNFVVASACSPTRSSILIGRDHLLGGVWGVGPRGNLRLDETVISQYFLAGGYRTANIGKWGAGGMAAWTPERRGFQKVIGLGGYYEHHNPHLHDETGKKWQAQGWTPNILTGYALDAIKSYGSDPWFMELAYIEPHSPWVCDPKKAEPFLKQGCSKPLATLYGEIAQLDEAFGQLLDGLHKLGVDKNTVIAFVSDNGPTPICEIYGHMSDEDWAKRNVLHLKGAKAEIWENGIRTPFLVRWPGQVAPGWRAQFGSCEDILPTLLDLAGLKPSIVPDHLPLDGISLKPVLENPAAPETDRLVLRFDYNRAPGTVHSDVISDGAKLPYEQQMMTVRGPRYKYFSLPGGKSALYDIIADPGENEDISSREPEVAAHMAAACREKWNHLIEGKRGFVMQAVPVGDPADGKNKNSSVPADMPQSVSGGLRVPFEGLVGFQHAGDRAILALDVKTAGKYHIVLEGHNLANAGPLRLKVAGQELAAGTVSKDPAVPSQPTASLSPTQQIPNRGEEINFGAADLPLGRVNLELYASADAAGSSGPAVVGRIKLFSATP